MKKNAFTLIELLIVVTIIGILAVALVPRIIGGSAQARDARRQADLQTIATGLSYYVSENGNFDAITDADNVLCSDENPLSSTLSGLIGAMPTDPQSDHDNHTCTGVYEILFLTGTNGALSKYAIVAELELPEEGADMLTNTVDGNPDYISFASETQSSPYTAGDPIGYFIIY